MRCVSSNSLKNSKDGVVWNGINQKSGRLLTHCNIMSWSFRNGYTVVLSKAAILFVKFEYRVERQVRSCVSSSIRVSPEGDLDLLNVFDRVSLFKTVVNICPLFLRGYTILDVAFVKWTDENDVVDYRTRECLDRFASSTQPPSGIVGLCIAWGLNGIVSGNFESWFSSQKDFPGWWQSITVHTLVFSAWRAVIVVVKTSWPRSFVGFREQDKRKVVTKSETHRAEVLVGQGGLDIHKTSKDVQIWLFHVYQLVNQRSTKPFFFQVSCAQLAIVDVFGQ